MWFTRFVAAVLVALSVVSAAGCGHKSGDSFPDGASVAPITTSNTPQANPGVPRTDRRFSVAISATPGTVTSSSVTLRASFIGTNIAESRTVRLVFTYQAPVVGPSQSPGEARIISNLAPGINIFVDQDVPMTSTPNIRVQIMETSGGLVLDEGPLPVNTGMVSVFAFDPARPRGD